jgi:hypothetical protein
MSTDDCTRTIDFHPGDVVWIGEWRPPAKEACFEYRVRYALVYEYAPQVIRVVADAYAPSAGWFQGGVWARSWYGPSRRTREEAQADVEAFVVETWGAKP